MRHAFPAMISSGRFCSALSSTFLLTWPLLWLSRLWLIVVPVWLIVVPATVTDAAQSTARAPHPVTEQSEQDEQAKAIAKEVFAGKDYWWKRTSTVNIPKTSLDRITDWLNENIFRPIWKLIGKIFEWFLGRSLPDSFVRGDWSAGVPFLWGAIFVGGALLAWRLLRNFRFPTTTMVPEVPGLSQPVSLLQADVLLQEARERLKNHDVRGSLRLVFLALLARLQDLGHLKYDRSKSNREYGRELHGEPDLSGSFRLISQAFERCWYGGYHVPAGEVAELIVRCERIGTPREGTE